jgi:hypothetical protein
MTVVWDSVHQDDIKMLGAAIRTSCQKCKELGSKSCLHQPRLISINQRAVEERAAAQILRNIVAENKFDQ